MSADRISYLDYLSMTIPSTVAFILRSPPISYVSNIFYLPFTGAAWIASIVCTIVCTVFVAITIKYSYSPDNVRNKDLDASDYFLFAVVSVGQLGTEIFTSILSARIAIVCIHAISISIYVSIIFQYFFPLISLQFVFFIALLFLFTSFTANIVALLQSTTNAFQTISDLQNPTIEIGVHDTPFNRLQFAAQTEPTRKRLYETRIDPANGADVFMNLTFGISRMRQGMFAFHVATEQGYDEVERTFLENEKCALVKLKGNRIQLWAFSS